MPYRVQTRTVDSPDALATEMLTYYDGPDFEGLPLGKVQVGLTMRVQERETAERLITRGRNRYDVHGNLLETVDGRGFATLFGYDDRDLLITSELLTGFEGPDGAYGLRKEVSYHPVLELVTSGSNWLRVRDGTVLSSRATTTFSYSQYGELTAIAAPGDTLEAPTTTYAYLLESPVSRIVEQTRSVVGGAFDLESVQCFDGRGRKYQGLGKIADGRFLADGYEFYAPQGAVARSHQPHEQVAAECSLAPPEDVPFTEVNYDSTGRSVAAYDPDASLYGSRSVSNTVYRPLETLAYDAIDNEPSSPHFNTPSRTRVDGLGRTVAISRIVDASEPEVTLTVTYDGLGRLAGLSDGLGYEKTQSYDLANRIVEERDPDRGLCTYAYDDTDNVIRREDARGVVTEWSFDAASRPLSEQDASLPGSRIAYRYDVPEECGAEYAPYAPGSRVEVRYPLLEGSGLDCAGYDARGRLFQSERRMGVVPFVFTSTYDNADRMTATTLPTGRVIETQYDGLSRVIAVPGLIDTVAYRFSGEPERIERANGTVDTMSYDVRLRLSAMGVDSGPQSLLARDLIRDRVSMVTDVVDRAPRSAGTPSADATYTYDAAYRLVEAYFSRARPEPPSASGVAVLASVSETLNYSYTSTDNVLSKTSSLGSVSRAHVGEYLYDSPRPHAVTTAGSIALDYDAAGNAVSIGPSIYTWDYRHKMTGAVTGEAQVATFAYDGDAVRVQKHEGASTTWHISPGFELRDGIATTWVSALGKKMVKLETATLAATQLPDVFPLGSDGVASEPDGRITIGDAWVVHARREGFLPNSGDSPSTELATMLESVARSTLIGPGESQTHLHHDALGTTALTTDEQGELISETLHYPYGEWRYRSDDQLEVYSYTGVERDQSTGLSANGARYLNLGLGRFTSPDPLYGDLATVLEKSPWEHNLYAYAGGNPVAFADPSGLCMHCPPENMRDDIAREGQASGSALAGYGAGLVSGLIMLLNAAFNAESHHDNPMERVEYRPKPGEWSTNSLMDESFRAGVEVGKATTIVGGLVAASRAANRRIVANNGVRASADPSKIRFTQTTAGGRGRAAALRKSMSENGWNRGPVDVVKTDKGLVTVDNTRVAVARELGIKKIPVQVHRPSDLLPKMMRENRRFGDAQTWGEALLQRTSKQRPQLPPTGTLDAPRMPD